jgi:tetratricopeptide (TPR) repeat protein
LFLADLKAAPASAKIQMNAGIAYMKLSEDKSPKERDSLLDRAIYHVQKEIDIYPKFLDGYFNLGVAYSRKGDYETAEKWWNKARELYPNDNRIQTYDKVTSSYYYNKGIQKGADKNFQESISCFLTALRYDSTNADIYYNLGGAYFTIQKLDSARYFFRETLKRNPQNAEADRGLKVIEMQMQQIRR